MLSLADSLIFLAGIFAGLAVNVSVGPVNLYVIRRALGYGFFAAFTSGLGAVVADLIYATAAALGTSTISSLISNNIVEVKIACGVLFIGYGIATLRKKADVVDDDQQSSAANLVGGFFTAFFMTIANPGGLVWLGALYAGAAGLLERLTGLVFDTDRTYPLLLGTLIGLVGWWFILTVFAVRLRYRFKTGGFGVVNTFLGAFIVVVGVYFVIDGIADILPEGWYRDFDLVWQSIMVEVQRFTEANF